MVYLRRRYRRLYGDVRRLKVIRPFDPWSSPLCTCPPKYSLHPYTGCSHFCLYCYATAYLGRRPSSPKKGFLKMLKHDLAFINKDLVIEMSTSSDPYPPLEEWVMLTRKTIELLVRSKLRILITTKSDIVSRDKDLLALIPSAVMITITTLDQDLASKLEPGAPPPSRRLKALEILSQEGIPVGARIDPIIPGLNDDEKDLRELVEAVAEAGAKHIVTSTYKARPDNFRRMIDAFSEYAGLWRKLYLVEGEKKGGYRYLPLRLRARILGKITGYAREKGLSYATCREGLTGPNFFNAGSCDGTHLIRLHGSIR